MAADIKLDDPVLIAILVENTEFTGGGGAAAFMLGFVVLATCASVFLIAANAIQQATGALVGLVLIVPLGFCAVIGRKHTYKVFRKIHPEEPRAG